MAGMDRRLALVALWAAFAVAAVGVGFGAAGLVGGPFSDGVADASGIDPSQQPADLDNTVSPGPEPSSTPTPTSTPRSGARASSPATTPDPGPASTEPPRTNPAPAASTRSVPARSVTRSITTRGGLVSATCRSDGFVQVSGSPAVGWEIEDIDGGARRDARVRFERPDGDSRVEVGATCARGAPRFALDDDGDGGGGGGDDDDDDDDGDYEDDSRSSSGGGERED